MFLSTILIVAIYMIAVLTIVIAGVKWAISRGIETDTVFDEVPFMVFVFLIIGAWLTMAVYG